MSNILKLYQNKKEHMNKVTKDKWTQCTIVFFISKTKRININQCNAPEIQVGIYIPLLCQSSVLASYPCQLSYNLTIVLLFLGEIDPESQCVKICPQLEQMAVS